MSGGAAIDVALKYEGVSYFSCVQLLESSRMHSRWRRDVAVRVRSLYTAVAVGVYMRRTRRAITPHALSDRLALTFAALILHARNRRRSKTLRWRQMSLDTVSETCDGGRHVTTNSNQSEACGSGKQVGMRRHFLVLSALQLHLHLGFQYGRSLLGSALAGPAAAPLVRG